MESESPGRFQAVWVRFVAVFAGIFIIYFIVTEFSGLLRLVEWALNGVALAPTALRNILGYYAAVPASQLWPSVLVGGLFGAFITAFITLRSQNILALPAPSGLAMLAGLAVTVGVGTLGSGLLTALALGLLAVVAAEALLHPEAQAILRPATLRALSTPRGRTALGRGLLLGAVVGALGSQILAFPLQHCTFAAATPSIQYELGILITMFSALIALLPTWSLFLRRRAPAAQATAGYFKGRVLPYLFLAPTLISLALFLYYPSMQTVTLSLNLRRFPLPQERFVCLTNYVNLAQDTIYQNSFITTFGVTMAIVFLAMASALGIAVLASQNIRGASIYRTLLVWPFALSPVIAGAVFLGMFREGGGGLINWLLGQTLGVEPQWLRDPALAPWVIILASVWNILGFNILFYIAGLQNVPRDLLEAAQIDGANRWQRFARITFPMLAPFTFFLLISNVTFSFYGIYGAVDTLTQGGPPLGPAGQLGGATNVLIFKLYEDAFNPGSPIGAAAAQALILFVLVAGITLLQFRYIESRITYGE